MNHETAMRLLKVQEEFRNSPEFEALWAEHQFLADQFREAMERLPKDDADIITDFFGIINEIHLRTLAYSVTRRE